MLRTLCLLVQTWRWPHFVAETCSLVLDENMLCWPKHVSYLITPVGMIYCKNNVLLRPTVGHFKQEDQRTFHLLSAMQVYYKSIVVLRSMLSLRPSSQWHVVQQQHTQTAFLCWLCNNGQWRTEGGLGCSNPPPPKFRRSSKIVPNSTRLWKLLKNPKFGTPTPQDVRKKGSKILKLPSVRNCFTLTMTNKLVVIINSLKVP